VSELWDLRCDMEKEPERVVCDAAGARWQEDGIGAVDGLWPGGLSGRHITGVGRERRMDSFTPRGR
jgi:hypothetical protein